MITSIPGLYAHPAYEAIKKALLQNESTHSLSKTYDINRTLLNRHKEKLLSGKAASVLNKAVVHHVDKIVDATSALDPAMRTDFSDLSPHAIMAELNGIKTEIKAMSDHENNQNKPHIQIEAMKLRSKICLDLINVAVKYNMQKEKDITESPQWLDLIGRIVRAIEPFPDAHNAVVQVLSE